MVRTDTPSWSAAQCSQEVNRIDLDLNKAILQQE